jgi:hypothetical protein
MEATYFDEMKWEGIKELVSDQHCVNAVCRGDIVNGVMPTDFQAVFATPWLQFLLLYSTEGWTRLHEVDVLEGGARMG